MLAHSQRIAIALTDVVAYSNGFEVRLSVRSPDPIDSRLFGFRRQVDPTKPQSEDDLRLQVVFADGSKASSADRPVAAYDEYRSALSQGRHMTLPRGPLVQPKEASGTTNRWDVRYWIWPLPPEGMLTMGCDWRARGVDSASIQIEGSAISNAGSKSVKVW